MHSSTIVVFAFCVPAFGTHENTATIYQTIDFIYLPFEQAQDRCVVNGGHLATIHSPEQAIDIHNYLHSNVARWIGVRRQCETSDWVQMDDIGWTSYDFRDQLPQVDGNDIDNCCIAMTNDLGLEAVPCYSSYHSVCTLPVTHAPTDSPSETPTTVPTKSPTIIPTKTPTNSPAPVPTPLPTLAPVPLPSAFPTAPQTSIPTSFPTLIPTSLPTSIQTSIPTSLPTSLPTSIPTLIPTSIPTLIPTSIPTYFPTLIPTSLPTLVPTSLPSTSPTGSPSEDPFESAESYDEDITGDQIESCQITDTYIDVVIRNRGKEDDDDDGDVSSDINCKDVVEGNGDEISPLPEVIQDDLYTESFCRVNGTEVSVWNYAEIVKKKCFELQGLYSILSDVIEVQVSAELDYYSFIMPYEPRKGDGCNAVDQEDYIDCSWFDVGKQEWSTKGCTTQPLNSTDRIGTENYIRCRCNHTTAFAILQNSEELKGDCQLSNVFGNNLWIVFAIIYALLIPVTLYRILKMMKSSTSGLERKRIVHMLMACVELFNVVIASLLYTIQPTNTPTFIITVLALVWGAMYTMSFWIFIIVVIIWISIVHMNDPYKIRLGVVCIGALLSIFIIIMFITVASVSGKTRKEIVTVGSLVTAIVCIVFAFIILLYGSLLVTKLGWVHRHLQTDPDIITDFSSLSNRVSRTQRFMSFSFVIQSVFMLISAMNSDLFFKNFTVFQTLYLACDILLLCSVLYLFWTYEDKQTRRPTETPGKSYSRSNVPMIEYPSQTPAISITRISQITRASEV